MNEVLVLLIEHDGDDSPAVALARNRAELLEQVKVAVWGEPHPADTTNDAGDDMAEGMTDTLLETGVMTFEGDPPLRLVRIPVDWFAAGVRVGRPLGCALAMRVMQSDLYRQLDDAQRADCDELIHQNLEWVKRDNARGVALPDGGQQ